MNLYVYSVISVNLYNVSFICKFNIMCKCILKCVNWFVKLNWYM